MNSFQYQFECLIDTTPHRVYEFHCDTNNLPKITPPWMKANIINIDLPLGTNSIIEVDIKQYGLNQKWLVQVDKMIPYNSVAEKALTSPFKAFYHDRVIEAIQNNKTLLKETITLSLPLFPLSLIALPLIKRDLQRMFEHRHRMTKAILER
ncbi:MAG: hypothetical protein FNT15_02135 [Sulfurovum sp.]|nr:MAG: hypothetical protein FNT15_02135 [Sulfurovum sp.]